MPLRKAKTRALQAYLGDRNIQPQYDTPNYRIAV
jgi:predicted secreted protein